MSGCKSCKGNDIEKDGAKVIASHNILFRVFFFGVSLLILPLVFVITAFYLFKIFVLANKTTTALEDATKLANWWSERKNRKLEKKMLVEGELETYEEANPEDYELEEVQEEKVV